MNFSAVRRFFRPTRSSQLEELARKHGGSRGEESVSLEEVGLDGVARESAEKPRSPPGRQTREN